ncbi:MAG: quinone oxidoreductase [Alphaproteobacteria bacterium]|nr:quinone oxidoreductase [Alphaproteobacteria bacterium]
MSAGAIVVHEYGGPEVLRWETVSAPPPGRGEVRLRQTAVGVNYIDVYCREGRFDLLVPPGVPGMEAAGVVLDAGPEVYGIGPGDRVGYACPPVGAYAEVRTMPADLLVVLPDGVSDEVAAAGLLKGITAEFLLHRVHPVKSGDVVLVHAAAGGVGLLLCQWARALGATVIGTVGSAEKAALARANGCAYPVLYREQDFADAVMDITGGQGADVVYDAVGRDTFEKSCAALAVHGHLVSYGQASGDLEPVDVGGLASKSATVSRPNYGHFIATPQALRAITDRLFEALRTGTIHVEPRQRYPLAEAARAHRDLESRKTMGATILTVGG